jgi:2-keto-4-pentenoate hydratase
MCMTSQNQIQEAADRLFAAHTASEPCAPVRDLIGAELEAGYRVQQVNTARWVSEGRRIVGRKIGLTSLAVQKQLGVDQPDFGVLFADMEYCDGDEIPWARLHQPKAEAEIAVVLAKDIDACDLTLSELVRAIDHVVPAIEIVGSRIKDWDIRISDTIADNASSGLYVLGGPVRPLDGLDMVNASMVMKCNGRPVSFGAGIACLGNPLNAALWLARKCAELGTSLQAGDVVLTGALGPMAPMTPGDLFEADISGLGSVRVSVSAQ